MAASVLVVLLGNELEEKKCLTTTRPPPTAFFFYFFCKTRVTKKATWIHTKKYDIARTLKNRPKMK
tara:strand:- start:199 stop:396 length:198 start_codon:yes stop_codon:yes gene_type:complete